MVPFEVDPLMFPRTGQTVLKNRVHRCRVSAAPPTPPADCCCAVASRRRLCRCTRQVRHQISDGQRLASQRTP
ncbi:unnamed protein product [Gadus morhua 'NCC']